MRHNFDRYFKLLFALQVAFLPLIIFGYIMFPAWLPLLFFCSIFLFRLWSNAYRDKANKQHLIISILSDFLIFTFCYIYFIFVAGFSVWLVVIALILNYAMFVYDIIYFKTAQSDLVIAFDYSNKFFMYLALLLLFISKSTIFWAKSSITAAIIVAALSLAFKIYKIVSVNINKKKFYK